MTINPLIAAKPSFRAAVRRAAVAACLLAASVPAGLADTSGGGDIHPPGLPCGYTVEVIERPGCPDPLGTSPIKVTGMNEAGIVVGHRRDCFEPTRRQAWIWHPGDTTPTDLPTPDDIVSSLAYDISDKNVIVGEFKRYLEPWRGFVYDTNTGEWTELEPVDPTGSGTASANAINNAGVVAGTRSIGDSHQPYNAFIWSTDDGYTDLGVMQGPYSTALEINESGTVTGWTGSSIVSGIGYLHANGASNFLGTPGDADTSIPNSINGNDTVVGTSHWYHSSGEIDQHAIVWDGEFAVIENLEGYNRCGGGDVSEEGIVVGSCTATGVSGWESFLWYQGNLVPMDENVLHGNQKQIEVGKARAMSKSGQILALGTVGGGANVGMVLTPIESPAGDLNGDCDVGADDLGLLLSEWGKNDSPADLTSDGTVGGADLGILLSNWTR